MYFLYSLGPLMETLFGPVRFLALYLTAALAGGAAVVLWKSNAGGASGANGLTGPAGLVSGGGGDGGAATAQLDNIDFHATMARGTLDLTALATGGHRTASRRWIARQRSWRLQMKSGSICAK